MFPEYVEKYNQQQQQEAESEVSAAPPREEDPMLQRPDSLGARNENVQGNLEAEAKRNPRNNKRRQPLPTWLLLLLFSIIGLVMALPLLQA